MKFVFCEGKDDLAVIQGVAVSIGLNDLNIEFFSGKDNLTHFLKAARLRPEFSRNQVSAVGIVRDADEDGQAAFQSVRAAMLANGFNAPEKSGGVAAGEILTGVMIIGPNDGKGMIEDLCLKSVSNLPEFPCVEDYFRCVSQKRGRADFSAKAKVRAWLATQSDHDLRVGKAAEAGYWPWQSPAFEPLKVFLKKLANASEIKAV